MAGTAGDWDIGCDDDDEDSFCCSICEKGKERKGKRKKGKDNEIQKKKSESHKNDPKNDWKDEEKR